MRPELRVIPSTLNIGTGFSSVLGVSGVAAPIHIGVSYLSKKLICGMTKRCHGHCQASPSKDQVSLNGNTRGAPKDVETRPALVVTNTEAHPVTIGRGGPGATPEVRAAALVAHQMIC